MDEKRKASKKNTQASSSSRSLFSRSSSTSNSPLLRSLSQKNSSSSSSSSKCNNNLPRSFSQKNPSIGRKCTNIAKEQKARFYIMRRCVAMLVCWHKHGDSWTAKMHRSCTRFFLPQFFFCFWSMRSFFGPLSNTIDSIVITTLTEVSYKIYTLLQICTSTASYVWFLSVSYFVWNQTATQNFQSVESWVMFNSQILSLFCSEGFRQCILFCSECLGRVWICVENWSSITFIPSSLCNLPELNFFFLYSFVFEFDGSMIVKLESLFFSNLSPLILVNFSSNRLCYVSSKI